MLKRIYQRFLKDRTPGPLGRWCHKEYNSKCRAHVKSDLANMDNSGPMTGLCKNKGPTILKIDEDVKKSELLIKHKLPNSSKIKCVSVSNIIFN